MKARVLDLYSGSGALGFEAISRGAGRVSFLENDRRLARAIEETAMHFGLDRKEWDLISHDAKSSIEHLDSSGERFDLIFADPPWDRSEQLDVAMSANHLLTAGGILVVEFEWSKSRARFESPSGLWRLRKYGRAGFAFHHPGGDQEESGAFDSRVNGA